ncbi:MAG: ATP-binding cassette domain-containing protein [Dehalococcoidia bacterium]|nr:ATP-binding cassette domain-containing protein [Dehalococcoidia bacterium]
MMNAIVVDHLHKRFRAVEAVKDVSFTVAEGEVFGFLGPNGAGKTTTINILCTLLAPTSGTALVNGFDVARQQSEVRRSIGLVFQETTVDDYLTAEENLRFHARAYRLPRDVWVGRAEELLRLVDLWDRRHDRVRTFSGGMKRRLELARGLLVRPRVLFLDEPTLGLDPQTRRHIWDYLLQVRRNEALTVFLTTHYLEEAEHCDRVAIIDHGQIVALDTPEHLKAAVGGGVVTIRVEDQALALEELQTRFGLAPVVLDGAIQFNVPSPEEFLPEFIRAFAVPLNSVSIHRPTLEDAFVKLTGHAIRDDAPAASTYARVRMRMR